MKLFRNLTLLSIVVSLVGCASKPASKENMYPGYKLLWSDEFDGEELNKNNWECMIGDGSPNTGWGNNELEYYTKDNVEVRDDMMVITAKREEKNGYHFTSARLRTQGKVFFTYGRVEARISLPEETGMWPAFWMLPETSYHNKWWPYNGEIDIMEARGRVNDMYSGAVHFANTSGTDQYEVVTHTFNGEGRTEKPDNEKTYISDFHLYSLEWDEDEMRWYFDNELIGKVKDRAWKRTLSDGTIYSPFDYDFHILLNLAIGGNFDDGRQPDPSFTKAEMKIDFVRVYTYDK